MERKPLKADPEKVREFQRRARENSKMGTRDAESPPKPLNRSGRRKQHKRLGEAGRARVRRRSGGVCVVCADHRIDQLHHLLEKRNFPQYANVEENHVGVCVGCHADHENAVVRIPWEALHKTCRRWLLTVAAEDGAAWRAVHDNYPGAVGALEKGSTDDR